MMHILNKNSYEKKLLCPNIRIKICFDYEKRSFIFFPCFGDCSRYPTYYDYDEFMNDMKGCIDDYFGKIQNGILLYGCDRSCIHFKNIQLNKKAEPKTIQLSIDYSCNLKCSFCCQRFDRDKKTFSEMSIRKDIHNDILKRMLDYDFNDIKIVGNDNGEPFSDNYFKNEWLFKVKNFKEVEIVSNMNMIDEDYITRLHDNFIEKNIPIGFLSSIVSTNKSTYEKIMVGGNFNKAIENSLYLDSLGILKTINYLITKDNLDEFCSCDIKEEFKKLGFHNCRLYVMEDLTRKEKKLDIEKAYDAYICNNKGVSFTSLS